MSKSDKRFGIPKPKEVVKTPRTLSKHKKKKLPVFTCPFCGSGLNEYTKWFRFGLNRHLHGLKCLSCGARETTNGCPNCKRTTWTNKKGGYKHMKRGCGYELLVI